MSARETRQEGVQWSGLLSNGNMFAEVKTAAQLCAEREEDILRLGAEHAKHCHSKEMLPPDMTARVNTAIKTVTANV
jgi:predicted small metal-binding protein